MRALLRAFNKRRHVKLLSSLEERLEKLLSPSDWAVVAFLSFVAFLSAGALLASVSLASAISVPTTGGHIHEGLVGNPRFLNPLLAISETDRDLTELVYSGLMKQESGGGLSPDIAESFTLSEDKLTYTFIIKSNAKFHDGAPVTAEDVAFTIRAAQNPEIKSPRRANWEGVTVETPDPRTVTFLLPEPYAPFLENTTIGILPAHIWRDLTPEEFQFSSVNAEPIGSGPYLVENVEISDSGIPTKYDLRAFDKGARTPFINRITFTFYQNAEELTKALKDGAIDAAHSIHPDTRGNERTLHEATFGRVFAVFFNQNQNDIFTERGVRAALDAAVDKRKIIDTVVGGYGSPLSGPLPSHVDETAVLSREERLARAVEILENAGWELGEDGVRVKTVKKEKKRLAFSLSTANAPELKRAAELVRDDWQAIGASVDVKFFEQNDLNSEVLRPRKYDALLFGLVIGRENDLYAFWHSSQRNDPGLNIALYANIDADKLLQSARSESDDEKRAELIEKAVSEIRDDVGAVFLYAPHFVYLLPASIQGVAIDTVVNPSDRFTSIEDWYLGSDLIWPIFK